MFTDRIKREKDFHNRRFNNEIRQPLDKYYSIMILNKNRFEEKLFNQCDGKKILEFGCGLGSYSIELSKRGAETFGIDISEVAIEKANEQAKIENLMNASFRVMNAEELDFPDSYFDVVCGVAILHHLDLNKSYREISRVLKPSGKTIFLEPLGNNPFINFYRKLTPYLRTEDEHPLKTDDLNQLNKFFSNVEISYFHLLTLFAVPFRNKSYFNSLLNFLARLDILLFKSKLFQSQAWQIIITASNPHK